MRAILVTAYLLSACCVWAQETQGRGSKVFSGGLQRVGRGSVTVRLADGLLVDARLSQHGPTADEIVAHYKLGDQVEIACKPIRGIYDEDSQRHHYLELRDLRFVRPPSEDELARENASRAWREAGNLLKAPSGYRAPVAIDALDPGDESTLQHARQVNLEYAANLPNYVADEIARHYSSSVVRPEWRYVQTVESEVTFRGSRATRERVVKDGRPWRKPFDGLPGFKWLGGFGAELRPLFDPNCPTALEPSGHAELRGRRVLVYDFIAPAEGCFGYLHYGFHRSFPGHAGQVYVEESGGHVIRFRATATGLPGEFEISGWEEDASWDRVRIGDGDHLLPVSATIIVRYASGDAERVDLEYRNHRHFESSTQVTFQ